ncbi:hypothetical protein HGT70_14260 [Rosenbergiella collisarenosi]|uniref:FtsX-like permease family protein n=1 Tax=Rosenbergiella collisarenosi TaxID=1544695 RepID=UPI001BD92095|nr:FtsX-like permease family protein [Rosenbergiella collisarenosi]MBT0722438.1 hypothetical protein [Rosenbergiella collisarenosi]
MTVRWIYILKSVSYYRLRFLLISLFIAAGFATLQISLSLSHALTPDSSDQADRQLLVLNGINAQMPLPANYASKLNAMHDVSEVSFATWTGAYFRHPGWLVPALAVEERSFFTMNPELTVEPQAFSQWVQQKNGVLVDERFARRYGLHVGGRLPLQSSIWPIGGSGLLDLIISGMVSNNDRNSFPGLYLHYDYFQDRLAGAKGLVSYFMVMPRESISPASLAKKIDGLFEGNLYQGITQTATKNIHMQQLIKRSFDIGRAISFINFSVFILLVILLVTNLFVISQKNAEEYGLLYLCGYQKKWIAVTAVLQQFAFVMPGVVVGSLAGAGLVVTSAIWGPLALTGLQLSVTDVSVTLMVAAFLLVLVSPAAIWQVMISKGRVK